MAEDVLIRTYGPGDHDQVWELHIEGVRESRAAILDHDPSRDDDLRDIEGAYLVDGSHFWVAEEGGRLIGMVAVLRLDAETGRLRRMRVTERSRRRGLGERLLEQVEEFCRGCGYRRVVLDTLKQQLAAQALYEKNSFVRTGERMLGRYEVVDYEKVLR